MSTTLTLRPPTFSSAQPPSNYQTPSVKWLMEEWHITHSSLPMWKGVRNIRIKYTALDPSSTEIAKDNTDRVDDLVTYQKLDSTKIQSVKGVDKATNGTSRGEWDWRGSGWLKAASSHWEILGWGEEPDGGNKWMVTMFAKTLFTPAGIDVYSLKKEGLTPATIDAIKKALAAIDDAQLKEMALGLFEIAMDDSRGD